MARCVLGRSARSSKPFLAKCERVSTLPLFQPPPSLPRSARPQTFSNIAFNSNRNIKLSQLRLYSIESGIILRKKKESVATLTSSTDQPETLHRYVNFYLYTPLSALESLRTVLLSKWGRDLGARGRVYLDHEGINAQLSVPARHFGQFKEAVHSMPIFKHATLFEGDLVDTSDPLTSPFESLHIRIRPLVMDGFGLDANLDMSKTGNALSPEAWHKLIEEKKSRDAAQPSPPPSEQNLPNKDCRNFYESDVGRFEGAVRLEIEKHLDSFASLDALLEGKEEDKIMIYCTGGIRCEKIAAYLTQRRGFRDVNRLHGGINNYAQFVKGHTEIQPNFKGKNFVFDQRLDANDPSTRVTSDVLSQCYLCGVKSDSLRNCANPACNMLFVACDICTYDTQFKTSHKRCCSSECESMASLPKEEVNALLAQMRDAKMSFKRSPYNFKPRSPLLSGGAEKRGIHTESREKFSSPLSEATRGIRIETVEEVGSDRAQNMVTPLQAQLLKMLVSISRAERILEIGTFTGYSALAMAEALPKTGKLLTCEKDSALYELAKKFISQSEFKDLIDIRFGDASATLDLLAKERLLKEMLGDRASGQFDLVFLDADKLHYSAYVEQLLRHNLLRRGGILIVDNILWRGLVFDPETRDTRAKAMRALLEQLKGDTRLTMVTLPISDGMLIAQVL